MKGPAPYDSGRNASQDGAALLVAIGDLAQKITRGLGLIQQFFKLIVTKGKHLNRSVFRSADRCPSFSIVAKCHLSKELSGSELCSDHIRLVRARQDYIDSAFGDNIKRICIGTCSYDHASGFVV